MPALMACEPQSADRTSHELRTGFTFYSVVRKDNDYLAETTLCGRSRPTLLHVIACSHQVSFLKDSLPAALLGTAVPGARPPNASSPEGRLRLGNHRARPTFPS